MSDKPISRQLAYARRNRSAGLCRQCGQAATASLCDLHLIAQRERMRAKGGWKARVNGGKGRPTK